MRAAGPMLVGSFVRRRGSSGIRKVDAWRVALMLRNWVPRREGGDRPPPASSSMRPARGPRRSVGLRQARPGALQQARQAEALLERAARKRGESAGHAVRRTDHEHRRAVLSGVVGGSRGDQGCWRATTIMR